MNAENAVKTAVGFFVVILLGALLSTLLGGAFAAVVAAVSPEFVSALFNLKPEDGIFRYAFVVGMIWGVFIGAAVSGFACFLAAIIKILKIRVEHKNKQMPNQPSEAAH